MFYCCNQLLFILMYHYILYISVSQADITKCVVNTVPSFHSHWLVAAALTCAHYLKAIVFYLLREK